MINQQTHRPTRISARWQVALSFLVIAAVVLIAYFPALGLSFVGDDWIFFELAGRLNLRDYLIKYFDPAVQTAWYRPVQGILFRIAYVLFRTEQAGYHLMNVLIHLANCFLLFALGMRANLKWNISFVAAILFASFPIAVEGVFKPGVIDPLTTTFSLLSVWFWLGYLRDASRRDYWLTFIAFLLALLSKEIAVTLPITLFLVDRLLVSKPVSRINLMRRYIWFVVVWIGYLPIEYIVTRRSVFVNREGYALGVQLFSNTLDYLSGLTFPWGFYPLVSYASLLIFSALLAYIIFFERRYELLCVIVGVLLAFLPIVPFLFVTFRFLYLSLAASAILFALLFDWIWRTRLRRLIWSRALGIAMVASLVVIGSAGIASASADFAEFARVSRIPFRDVRQAHPTFPDDTYLYFFYPPLPGPNLSGMFFWRYGPRVFVGATDSDRRAGLRDHTVTYVYYFDGSGKEKEQRIEKESVARMTPLPPVDFVTPIRLDGYELVSANVQRDQAILLLLYWRGLKRMDTDYIVSVMLKDRSNNVILAYAKPPQRGDAPTSSWIPDRSIVDAIQILVPTEASSGSFRLEIELHDSITNLRVGFMDAQDAAISGILIEPVNISE